ncbi:hypothetical protein ACVIU7_004405 [Bradyrhizobium liaoningense]
MSEVLSVWGKAVARSCDSNRRFDCLDLPTTTSLVVGFPSVSY